MSEEKNRTKDYWQKSTSGICPPHPEDITIYGMSYDCPDIQTRLLLNEGSLRTEKQWLEDIYIVPVFS